MSKRKAKRRCGAKLPKTFGEVKGATGFAFPAAATPFPTEKNQADTETRTVVWHEGKTSNGPKSILLEAESLVNGDRQSDYGPIREDYTRTVAIFKAWTGIDLKPEQGVQFMVCVKLSREGHKHKRDNLLDAVAYLSLLNDMKEGVR